MLIKTITKRKFPDIKHRKKVWLAMSDLFLDTDTKLFHKNIVNVLLVSPYNVDEIQNIMLYEVYPICRWNLISPVGEWAGFDEKWLVDKILKKPSVLSIFWTKTIGRITISSHFGWHKIIKEIRYRRTN